MPDLGRKRTRDRLQPRREPYWQRLGKGAYLGFRRGPDSWIARYRNRDGKQVYHALPDADDYDDAKDKAETWLRQLGSTAVRSAKRGTVREALESYLAWLKDHGRESTATTCEERFELIVWEDPLAGIRLQDLTRDDMREWRDRLRDGRKPRSINRHVRSIVAGLNRAHELGHVGNAEAWKLAPLADDVEEAGETTVVLDADQRKAIIAAADPVCGQFLRGLELTGARPKELAEAIVADFDKSGTLTLRHRKGRPARVRTRNVTLPAEAVAFFRRMVRGKTPKAPLLVGPGGGHWDRHQWSKATRRAIDAHNAAAKEKKRVPPEASAYSFRHARISELLQIYGIDPLTVAMQTGTSVRMIEQAYFKFIAPALREKLKAVDE